MSLLQILEPGSTSETPVALRRAVGIDLGTTHSLVATVEADGSARILLDETGAALLPSVVSFLPDGGLRVGRAAQALAGAHPRTTFRSIKRFMGRGAGMSARPAPCPTTSPPMRARYVFIRRAGRSRPWKSRPKS